MTDLNGGLYQSGDEVTIETYHDWYVSAENGGGTSLFGWGTWPGSWERFVIQRLAGPGPIASGNEVALRTFNGHYVVAELGGGDIVNANRTAVGPWETFVISIR